jgi:hypothetical protein
MIEVQTQPATKLPRDAKPSEIVRGLPESRWCAGMLSGQCADGHMAYCAIGILAEEGGFDWSRLPDGLGVTSHTFNAMGFVEDTYGVPFEILERAFRFNDSLGKDAAADWLEFCGY